MEDRVWDGGAFDETVVFLRYFEDLPDPRQRGKVIYPLDEVLLLCLLAVLAGAEAITDIVRFGYKKLELLRRFRPFADGTPAHDHLGDILASLDAEQFQRCFAAWVRAQTGVAAEVIAIDGKTLRRSKGAKAPVHMVSAFAARQRIVLGQVKVADKANEIVAIPRLLDLLAIEGAIVTIDAMGCQRDIARKIIDKRADYVLALKGNQGSSGRLTLEDFNLDEDGLVVTCPNGVAPVSASGGKAKIQARFDLSICGKCPDKAGCPIKTDKQDEQFGRFQYTSTRVENRKRQLYESSDEFRQIYRWHAGIEATMSRLKHQMKLACLRIRGMPAMRYAVNLRALGLNIRRCAAVQA